MLHNRGQPKAVSAPEKPETLHRFVLEALDPNLGCPVLEMMLRITERETLRTILGEDAADDAEEMGQGEDFAEGLRPHRHAPEWEHESGKQE